MGILAHVDAGKTTLSEAMLYLSGAIRKAGRVDHKDTFLDTYELERARGITIFSKQAVFEYNETRFDLLDTPGHTDFSPEMERTLQVLDLAVLMISASDGVTGQVKLLYKLLDHYKIPTVIFVNKMDQALADKDRCLNDIRNSLSSSCIDLSEGYDAPEIQEELAMCDEALLSDFLNGKKIEKEDIYSLVRKRNCFPILFGSALKMEGVKELLDLVSDLAPTICSSEILDSSADVKRKSTPTAGTSAFGARVFKISRDPSGNRLTHLKITGGTLNVRDVIGDEKVDQIRIYAGDKYEAVQSATAGMICSVTGLKNTSPGQGLGYLEGDTVSEVLQPILSCALLLPEDINPVTVYNDLKNLEEEEPMLRVSYSEETKSIEVRVMGEVQKEILKHILKTRFNIEAQFGPAHIVYKETIAGPVEGVGHFEPLRHYAEVHLLIEPTEPGSGISFDSNCSTDELALNWQRLILTHLAEKKHLGVLTGSELTDVKITLIAGRAHEKHTEGGDFRQATYRAVRQGLMMAESTLLEPFYFYELTVPENAVGRAMTDIDRMWGTAEISERHDGISVITGKAPVSTLNGYAKEVAAYTKGLGTLSVSLAGYEPCHNALEVIEARAYSPENDLRNTPDSVFCSHGAGTVIPWHEVYNYMHLPLMDDRAADTDSPAPIAVPTAERKEIFVTTEEIDEIINKTAYANRSGRQGSFKGISESMREKRRIGGKPINPTAASKKAAPPKEKYMLIDGYNVVHAWEELNGIAEKDLNGAAGRLMDIVSNYSAITGIKTILVFDAYKVPGHSTEKIKYHNITVVYTKTAETADRYIERYAHENGKNYDIVVVTSDGVEQVIIRGAGCTLMSSRDFYEDCNRKSEDLKSMKLPDSVKISED